MVNRNNASIKAPANALDGQWVTYPDASEFGWRDITGQVIVRGQGVNDPDWTQIGSGPFYAYDFGVNDQCWFVFHIPHDIVPAVPIHLHVHWLTDGTNTNPVRWEFTYSYSRGFSQDNFDADGTTATAESAAAGSAYRHMVTETDQLTIAGLDEPDGLVLCRVRRVANGATDNTDGIFLLTADVHYQSTNRGTWNKSPVPSFYHD